VESVTPAAGQIAMGLIGGLAIFLFGLDRLTGALKAVAGERMRDLLAGLTTNRFKGVLAGGLTTAVIQSSSVTTVLAVGFVSAGLMSMPQTIGIIMGAQIGTTVTAQIIAFKVTQYALVAVSIGFMIEFVWKDERVQRYGMMIMGLGLVFFGMNLMGDATGPLRSYQPFIELLQHIDEPLFAILLSASLTALIQSSSATTGMIIVLAGQGLIGLEQGIALVLGANIGTCVTALLASIGKERDAVRTALIHVAFNVLGVILWFHFIGELAQLIRAVSPVAEGLEGITKLAAETPRQIANAHTVFNLGNTLIFIWFTGAFAWFVTKLVPDRPGGLPEIIKPKYLDPVLLEAPALALNSARMELVRLGAHTAAMVKQAPRAVMSGSQIDLNRIRSMDDEIDILHGAIIKYLGLISRQDLTPRETGSLQDFMNIANHFESVGDVVEVDLVHSGQQRIKRGVRISAATHRIIQSLSERVSWALETATTALERNDSQLAQQVIAAKPEINSMADKIADVLAERLVAEEPHRIETFQLESDLVEQLKRVYYFAKRIAKHLVDEPDVVKKPPEEDSAAKAA
jgi:phosphate:Na+ symporter